MPAAGQPTGRHGLGLKVGQAVAWTHPYSHGTNYGRVARITDRFVEVRDAAGTEGILPAWIVWTATRGHLLAGARDRQR